MLFSSSSYNSYPLLQNGCILGEDPTKQLVNTTLNGCYRLQTLGQFKHSVPALLLAQGGLLRPCDIQLNLRMYDPGVASRYEGAAVDTFKWSLQSGFHKVPE